MKARNIPTEMPSSNISTRKSLQLRPNNNPSSPVQEAHSDLTLDTLSSDLAFVVRETASRMSWAQLPDIILIGHSLGGAVITDVANKRLLGSSLLGYGVLDVVEGL